MATFEDLEKTLRNIYNANPFVRLLQIKFVKFEPGLVILEMPIVKETHTNLHGIAHGGTLASLADTAMGVVCATFDKKVVTLNMNINYLKPAPAEESVRAVARTVHNGQSTVVAEAELLNRDGILLAKTSGTFFVVGNFSGSI